MKGVLHTVMLGQLAGVGAVPDQLECMVTLILVSIIYDFLFIFQVFLYSIKRKCAYIFLYALSLKCFLKCFSNLDASVHFVKMQIFDVVSRAGWSLEFSIFNNLPNEADSAVKVTTPNSKSMYYFPFSAFSFTFFHPVPENSL